MASSTRIPLSFSSKFKFLNKTLSNSSPSSFSTTATPYPLQYDLIISRPAHSQHTSLPRRKSLKPQRALLPYNDSNDLNESNEEEKSEMGVEGWVHKKLSEKDSNIPKSENLEVMDKSKRKYYNKRRKRMYGSDSDDEKPGEDELVELKQEVVDFPRLHQREEELYFYDAFAYPWEKDKHYKMVYQLEKKYFPDQCFDKAFVQPGEEAKGKGKKSNKLGKSAEKKDKVVDEVDNNKGMVFFEEKDEGKSDKKDTGSKDITERKVEEFFKCLKKAPNKAGEVASEEPYLVTRSSELPARWDSPCGTVVLVNKPKGWTSFTVCGKLRRLVKVQKVGHAGTLDPMATGLLIVCIGKATKVVDRFQGMVKGYSGTFRLGEATSTWDADSPVIQRDPWEHIKDEDIKKVAASFCGEIWQVPPMFSAIKIGGEKMYEKARRGETIELSPRKISIFQFDIERSLNDRQNLIFRVTCSKGTYIRSLCADLGKALGSCAHLTALRRDSIGQYSADNAWEFQELEEAITKSYF
ncbi:tRNA pseudouridine synthase B [Thalictrum thalictroides]|uniref:tRNA pseudouridine(55) synthase n=1 Tax=Thalictrum thalictroides TaxID=46969 RepID=A0A7J6VJ77_THATH|nr:tRNA pseudouridine synthase B [Thalictrum thalictroides]